MKFFSPLEDEAIPDDVDALIFGGGFPEVFAQELMQNTSMIKSIRKANERKMPIYAECGGFMYLMQGIYDFEQRFYEMVGIIPAKAQMNKKLQTVGYVKAKILQDNILGKQNDEIKGHEFHFSTQIDTQDESFPWAFEFTKMRNNMKYKAGYAKDNIVGSYLHLHFLGSKQNAKYFVEIIRAYKKSLEMEEN